MNDFTAHGYDAFEIIGTTFRELHWKTPTFFERAIPISPNACYDAFGGFGASLRQLG